jgi:hypothetical protein
MLDRPNSGYDAREINRAALKHWPIVASHLFDLRGYALGEVARLSPSYIAQEPGRARPPGTPRLIELRGPSPHDGGSWRCLGGASASGEDVISLVAYLGQCDHRTAGEWLKGLCSRLVELPA